MVTKAELKILEKAFMAGLTGTYFQSESKLAKKLVEDGLLQEVTSEEITCFGMMIVRHLNLTLLGHFIYCDSCAEE
ncbi:MULTISPECIES: hypothetical protein [unclassified Gilliamella]|uniref:hypothetical protein n=1 Tax=unclassified Gilliamella TaxID=2685620 RepID=UPI00080E3360|nr:hypothetical protein [Gilliamella apicola]OCG34796.1 hypothetical protein A9G32_08550 [Gilliamella apicola]OCG47674.1 hypothetical protein A9G26_11185 [Gilliamella apicola]OCG50647.1 hypothetical protein A9G27_01230 [Gilliamella apicola]